MSSAYPTEKSYPTSRSHSLPDRATTATRPGPRWNPRNWTRKTWLIVAVVAVIVLVATIVGGVLGAKANAYPDYSQIEYKLQDTYAGDDFFDNFDYFSGYDPTNGFVHYVDEAGSKAQNLTSTASASESSDTLMNSGTAILRVDTSDTNATTGRRSVRISSKKTYTTGLFIFDILHAPYGCATWPAVWLSDLATWPENGEIDVVETVNVGDTGNQMTLHTTDGCQIGKSRKRKQTGEAISYDCFNGTNGNQGCGVSGPVSSYGEAFNAAGGGVYAMELRSEGIRMWLFPRDNVPADIKEQKPDPSTWDTPLADFPNLECDIGAHFKNMSLVANIDLCGDWAGAEDVFSENSMCTGTCSEWVAERADEFEKAYWEFGGWWVYQGV